MPVRLPALFDGQQFVEHARYLRGRFAALEAAVNAHIDSDGGVDWDALLELMPRGERGVAAVYELADCLEFVKPAKECAR